MDFVRAGGNEGDSGEEGRETTAGAVVTVAGMEEAMASFKGVSGGSR